MCAFFFIKLFHSPPPSLLMGYSKHVFVVVVVVFFCLIKDANIVLLFFSRMFLQRKDRDVNNNILCVGYNIKTVI